MWGASMVIMCVLCFSIYILVLCIGMCLKNNDLIWGKWFCFEWWKKNCREKDTGNIGHVVNILESVGYTLPAEVVENLYMIEILGSNINSWLTESVNFIPEMNK